MPIRLDNFVPECVLLKYQTWRQLPPKEVFYLKDYSIFQWVFFLPANYAVDLSCSNAGILQARYLGQDF